MGLKKVAAKAAAAPAVPVDDELAALEQQEYERLQEEAKRKAEEERKAAEDAKRAADEEKQRRIREERLRKQEEERKRQEEEERKREEDKKRKEEERLRKLKQAEAERKRQAELEEQKKNEQEGILKKLEEQRRRVQEREKEQAEEERKKKEVEDERRRKIEEDKKRREEEAAAAERKRRDQEEQLKKRLDETAHKRAEDARRKQQEEEEALRAMEEERAEEERIRKAAEDERRRKEKAEKAALRFSSFMKQLQGVPEEEIFKELEEEDKEKNALEEIDRQLREEKRTQGAKTMAEGGQAQKLKYFSKFDRTHGADNRKPRKGGMRQHLKNIEYRNKRSKLHQKMEQEREMKRKEDEERKKKESEVLNKLQRQQQRINELGGRSRISIMLKETMGKGNAQVKAKQLATNDKALSMLDELETMIEEEEKREKDEFSSIKKKMDQKRAGKDMGALEKSPAGRGSSAGTTAPSAADTSARNVASPNRNVSSPQRSAAPTKAAEPAPIETQRGSTRGDHDGSSNADSGGGDSSVLDELDMLIKVQTANKEKQQELNMASRGSAGKPLPGVPPKAKKPSALSAEPEPETPPPAPAPAKDRRLERFSVLLQNLAVDPIDIPPVAEGETVDDGALDLLDDLIEDSKSPRGRASIGGDAPPDLPPVAPPTEDPALEEERARLREEEERLQRMEEDAARKKKERLSRTSMRLEATNRVKPSFDPLSLGAAPAAPSAQDRASLVPASPRGGGDAFMRELAELERQQAEQLAELQALEGGGGLPASTSADALGFDQPPSVPLDPPPSMPAPDEPPLDDLPPEEDEEPLTGPIDPARAAPDICYTCGVRVDDDPSAPEPLRALDRLWHKECWVCYECKMPLLGSRFGADGPFIYCESDYQRKFFCAACGQMITDHDSKVADGRFYHGKCFTERNDEQDSDFKAWMENFSKVREGNAPDGAPRASHQLQQAGQASAATATPAGMGIGIETDGGALPPPRMSMMAPPPPPGGEPPSPPTANPRYSEKPLPEKPLPKPPEKTLPAKPAAPAPTAPGIKPGAVTPASAPLPELTRELSKTISFREGPKVIQSPKDIVALEQPEKYLFQVTLPTAAHGMEAEKAGFTVKIFDVRGNNVIVTRKYKDFRSLYEELSSKHYPKAKVPKVPKLKDKDKVKTEHAAEVESFLNLCGHLNGIWQVPVMRAFISGEDPRKQKNPNEIVIGRPIDFKHVAHMGGTK